MKTDNPELESLYLKKNEGTLSQEEQSYLDRRLQGNASDKIEFARIDAIWKATGKLSLEKGVAPTDRWTRLQQSIHPDQQPRSVPMYRFVWPYAAAIITLAIVFSVYFYSNSSEIIRVETKYAESKTVELPDESTVRLNAGSFFTYDEATWDDARTVELQGEAFFEVRKNAVPFTVTTNNSRVQVLGTTFNVRSRHDNTEVICLTGKVDFGAKEIGKSVVLTGGKRASIHGKILSEVFEVGPDRTIPWIAGDLAFHETPLMEVFSELELHFDVSITVKRDLGNLTFTGKFKQPRLSNVIEAVCLSAGLEYTINKNSVIIQ
jgi:transmembrane sensor